MKTTATPLLGWVVLLAGCPTLPDLPQPTNGTGTANCTPWTASIREDTTFTSGCFNVTSSFVVDDGATMTVEPGVTLNFAVGTGLRINDVGALVAVGTPDRPIVLTSAAATPGSWRGVSFSSSNLATNRLEHVIIEYAGEGQNGNLVLDGSPASPARITLSNCTFRNGARFGFYFDVDSTIDAFTENTSTTNAAGPGSLTAGLAEVLDQASTYSGNTIDAVEVRGGTVDRDGTWAALDVPWHMTASATVTAALTLQEGVTVAFDSATTLTVEDTASLSAIGSAGRPVLFTAIDPAPGAWGGVRLLRSMSPRNRMEFVTIEYGGGVYDGNLSLDGSAAAPAAITVVDSIFRHSATYGVYVDDHSTVNGDIAGANTFKANVAGDVRLPGS